MVQKVIRITRHPVEAGRTAALQQAFGADVIIIDDDVPYGADPVKAVVDLLAKHGKEVVAVEVVAPVPVLARLTQAKRELYGVLLLRAEFEHGHDGRAKVIGLDEAGRDILAFSHYEVIERVEVVKRRLEPLHPTGRVEPPPGFKRDLSGINGG